MERFEDDVNSLTPIASTDERELVNLSVLSVYQSAEDLLAATSKPQIFNFNSEQPNSLKINGANGEDLNNIMSQEITQNARRPEYCREYSSLYFSNDSAKSVDFVLVWDNRNLIMNSDASYRKREFFENNLLGEGLEMEKEQAEPGSALTFIKIHAPEEVLRRYSEILKLRMPMKEERRKNTGSKQNLLLLTTKYISQKIPKLQDVHDKTSSLMDSVCSCVDYVMKHIYVDHEVFPPKSHRFTAVYSRDKEYLFDTESDDFFTPAIRSRIVDFILDRQYYVDEGHHDPLAFGINRLTSEQVYSAAYPLHDGDLKTPGSQRYILLNEWASVTKCLRYQPLDYVKEYFGVKIGLYFAWLGFYTHMLIPASIIGVICFVYSCLTLYQNQPSEDICNKNVTVKMCPICDYWCDYWDLSDTCLHARITYLFDNATTVFFAIFMSFWAALFLELWKRYSAEITHRWDLTGFDIQEEHPRPQYLVKLAHVDRKKLNVITNCEEPYVPFWSMRFPATILSFSVVLLLVLLALAAVLGVVLYRMSVLAALSVFGDQVNTSNAILFTTVTAATINLFCIMGFNYMYMWLAEYLTELELLRTQTEFDDSLTLKIYLLQFVNYYASIFYIAFFKGKFIGYPGNYSRFLKYRQEECGPGGCLMELCIQLAIIMIGKQAMNTMLEMLWPILYKWYNTIKIKAGMTEEQRETKSPLQWCKDFKLVEWGPRSLFPEYLEMVLQYGFVTIFVAAFPLAPFFALLNNILEMRLDARKLLTYYRRPVTQRVRDIGVWYRILDSIGKLSVITNGFIIAFTTDFIPRMVYQIAINPEHNLDGYLNYSLASFNTSEFEPGSAPHVVRENVSVCRYADYRHAHDSDNKYETTAIYWHILAARFAFVVVFENVVALVMILVRWCIPDVPRTLREQIRREAYLTNQLIIDQEKKRAQQHLNASHASSQERTTQHDSLRKRHVRTENHGSDPGGFSEIEVWTTDVVDD